MEYTQHKEWIGLFEVAGACRDEGDGFSILIIDDEASRAIQQSGSNDAAIVRAAIDVACSHSRVERIFPAAFGAIEEDVPTPLRPYLDAGRLLVLLDLGTGVDKPGDAGNIAGLRLLDNWGLDGQRCSPFTKSALGVLDPSLSGRLGKLIHKRLDYTGEAYSSLDESTAGVRAAVREWIDAQTTSDGIIDRVWPPEASNWFLSGHAIVPHRWTEYQDLPSDRKENCRSILATYLQSLLGFEAPKRWFEEEAQLCRLYGELKWLTAPARAKDDEPCQCLGAGGFLLLLAAGTASNRKGNGRQAWVDAISSLDWTKFRYPVDEIIFEPKYKLLPFQSREQTEETVLAAEAVGNYLAGTREGIEKTNPVPLLHSLAGTHYGLSLVLNMDCLEERLSERKSLIERLRPMIPGGANSGQFYTMLRRLIVATWSGSDFETHQMTREQFSVINFRGIADSRTRIEVRVCL